MTNAQIVEAVMGITSQNIPYIQIAVKEQTKTDPTVLDPIFLIDPNSESLQQSSMGEGFVSFLQVCGAMSWNEVVGKIIRVETNEDGKIIELYNAISDFHVGIGNFSEEESSPALDAEIVE